MRKNGLKLKRRLSFGLDCSRIYTKSTKDKWKDGNSINRKAVLAEIVKHICP
jgi:hypothetical protein